MGAAGKAWRWSLQGPTGATSRPSPVSFRRAAPAAHEAAIWRREVWSPTLRSVCLPTPAPLQHKQEAKAFYAFLSQVYDYVVNPGHWTTDMREDALEPAQLSSPDLKVRTWASYPGCQPPGKLPPDCAPHGAPASLLLRLLL